MNEIKRTNTGVWECERMMRNTITREKWSKIAAKDETLHQNEMIWRRIRVQASFNFQLYHDTFTLHTSECDACKQLEHSIWHIWCRANDKIWQNGLMHHHHTCESFALFFARLSLSRRSWNLSPKWTSANQERTHFIRSLKIPLGCGIYQQQTKRFALCQHFVVADSIKPLEFYFDTFFAICFTFAVA